MALFAIWHDESGLADPRHAALLDAAHVVPERITATAIDTPRGRWQLAAFACESHFYTADAQVWIDPAGGACGLMPVNAPKAGSTPHRGRSQKHGRRSRSRPRPTATQGCRWPASA